MCNKLNKYIIKNISLKNIILKQVKLKIMCARACVCLCAVFRKSVRPSIRLIP